ncbi:MAG: EVE domain-containing protein [Ignavibacteriales bacterium]|nr:EVE domain-containing protein [Ignavibacteriales bacterium]
MASYWLLKTEPGAYSYDDLERDKKTVWDGVMNPVALKNIRSMRKGDRVFIYHTGAQKAVVGIAEVSGSPYPDPKANDPKIMVVEIRSIKRLRSPVSLSSIKSSRSFAGFELVRLPRLSVMPVSTPHWNLILAMGGK